MNLQAKLAPLIGKPITVYIIAIGSALEYAGLLLEVGDGWLTIDNGKGGQPQSLIPFTAVASISFR